MGFAGGASVIVLGLVVAGVTLGPVEQAVKVKTSARVKSLNSRLIAVVIPIISKRLAYHKIQFLKHPSK
jgi:hypothetical protein